MHFCVERLRVERDATELGALYLSLNSPVIAIEELPVGPARAGIALYEACEGAICLRIAVRSLRTGQVISYTPDEVLANARDAAVAVDAALSFTEGMGFLFDEDEVAERPEGGSETAAALWRELLEEVPENARAVERPAPPPAATTPPDPDPITEVPVREVTSAVEPVVVEEREPLALRDIAAPADGALAVDVVTATAVTLSKFRLALGGSTPSDGAPEPFQEREDTRAISVLTAAQDSRIRLLSRF